MLPKPFTKETLSLALKLNSVNKTHFNAQVAFELFQVASHTSKWGGSFQEAQSKLSALATAPTREEAVNLTANFVGISVPPDRQAAFDRFVDALLFYYANKQATISKEALELMDNALRLTTGSQALPKRDLEEICKHVQVDFPPSNVEDKH